MRRFSVCLAGNGLFLSYAECGASVLMGFGKVWRVCPNEGRTCNPVSTEGERFLVPRIEKLPAQPVCGLDERRSVVNRIFSTGDSRGDHAMRPAPGPTPIPQKPRRIPAGVAPPRGKPGQFKPHLDYRRAG